MKKFLPALAGVLLLATGLTLSRMDIGSPATGDILLFLGIALLLWHFLRHSS